MGKPYDADEDKFDVSTLPVLNYISRVQQNSEPYSPQALLAMSVKPRMVKRLGRKNRGKSPWKFEKSAFRNYKPDT